MIPEKCQKSIDNEAFGGGIVRDIGLDLFF